MSAERRKQCSQRPRDRTAGVQGSEASGPGSILGPFLCLRSMSSPCLTSPPPLHHLQEPAWIPAPWIKASARALSLKSKSQLEPWRQTDVATTIHQEGKGEGGTYSPSLTLSTGHPVHHQGRSHHPQSPRGPRASRSSRCASAEPGEGR